MSREKINKEIPTCTLGFRVPLPITKWFKMWCLKNDIKPGDQLKILFQKFLTEEGYNFSEMQDYIQENGYKDNGEYKK